MTLFFRICGVFLALSPLFGERVDLITDFSMDDIPIEWQKIKTAGYDLSYASLKDYEKARSPKDPDLKRIIVMNNCLEVYDLFKLPKEKLVLFLWEPRKLDKSYYDWFSRVYTWDDNLVDNKKFFKLYYPYLTQMASDLPPFEEKKFCTLIANHWTAERVRMVEFFQRSHPNDLEFYGRYPGPFAQSKLYLGKIPGYHSGPEKIDTLKKYRFCICFENTTFLRGYVTEKILNCFSAGCVPVYWGAQNVETYIPKECYIDFRDFQSEEELYKHLKGMTKERYDQHLEAIRAFLASDKAKVFAPGQFEETFIQAINKTAKAIR